MSDDLSEAISEAALNPQSATVDGITVTQRSLKELIEFDKYQAAKTAVHTNPAKALVRLKMVPPGM